MKEFKIHPQVGLNVWRRAEEQEKKSKQSSIISFCGLEFTAKNDNMKTFENSLQCNCCGESASYFKVEENIHENRKATYIMRLYGVINGKEILFTKDHIIPKAKGGKNQLRNYQTMCEKCNKEKGSRLVWINPEHKIAIKKKIAKLSILRKHQELVKSFV